MSLKNKETLEKVSGNLDYSKLKTETRKNGENIIIIPIAETVKAKLNSNAKHLKLSENSILNLIIVQSKTGKLRWSSIISYQPTTGKSKRELSDKTVQNIINGDPVEDDGMYKFIDLKGELLYQLEYKSGKLYSIGRLNKRNKSGINSGEKAVMSAGAATMSSLTCFDWYLVLTWYYEDGSSFQTEEYLFTNCNQDQEPTEGGGGGGEQEEPIDQEVTISGSFDETESNFSEDDYQSSGEEAILDEFGEAIFPAPVAVPLVYRHNYTITIYPVIVGKVVLVEMNDATVHPSNITYPQSGGAGTVTRNITLFNQAKSDTHTETSVTMTWTYSVHFRWTYSSSSVSRTMLSPRNYSKTVPI